jgi:uncharacterized protein
MLQWPILPVVMPSWKTATAASGGSWLVIYLDTSAAMKLVRPEVHSVELSRWLEDRAGIPVLSSVLIEVELMRATRRSAPDRLAQAAAVLRGIGVMTLSPPVVDLAADYTEPDLRSLDAIHLAAAEHLASLAANGLEAFVCYDDRLLAAAGQRGLPVANPGASHKTR